MKYRSFDSGILLCFQDFVFYILLLHRSYFIELILNFSGRSRCQETYDYVYCKTKKECRKQFVNTKCTTQIIIEIRISLSINRERFILY